MLTVKAEGRGCGYDAASCGEPRFNAGGNNVYETLVSVRFVATGIDHLFNAHLELSEGLVRQSLRRNTFDRW